MEYYGNNDWRDYLALKHYGVKGMKWHKHLHVVNAKGSDGTTVRGVAVDLNRDGSKYIGVSSLNSAKSKTRTVNGFYVNNKTGRSRMLEGTFKKRQQKQKLKKTPKKANANYLDYGRRAKGIRVSIGKKKIIDTWASTQKLKRYLRKRG